MRQLDVGVAQRFEQYVVSQGPLTYRIRMSWLFVFQAEDGIRDLVRSRGLGDVYKRQPWRPTLDAAPRADAAISHQLFVRDKRQAWIESQLSLIHI